MVTTNEPNIYETGVLDPNAEGNFVYTTLDAAINWIVKIPLWPMPMGLSCCCPRVHGRGPAPGTTFPVSAPK